MYTLTLKYLREQKCQIIVSRIFGVSRERGIALLHVSHDALRIPGGHIQNYGGRSQHS